MSTPDEMTEEERIAKERRIADNTRALQERVRAQRIALEAQTQEKDKQAFVAQWKDIFPRFDWEARPLKEVQSGFSAETLSINEASAPVDDAPALVAFSKRSFGEHQEAEIVAYPNGGIVITPKDLSEKSERQLAIEMAIELLKNNAPPSRIKIRGDSSFTTFLVSALVDIKAEGGKLFDGIQILHNGTELTHDVSSDAEFIERDAPNIFDEEKIAATTSLSAEEKALLRAYDNNLNDIWLNNAVGTEKYEEVEAKYTQWRDDTEALFAMIMDKPEFIDEAELLNTIYKKVGRIMNGIARLYDGGPDAEKGSELYFPDKYSLRSERFDVIKEIESMAIYQRVLAKGMNAMRQEIDSQQSESRPEDKPEIIETVIARDSQEDEKKLITDVLDRLKDKVGAVDKDMAKIIKRFHASLLMDEGISSEDTL